MKNIRWNYVLMWAFLALSFMSIATYSYYAFGLKMPLTKRLLKEPNIIWAQVTVNSTDAQIQVGLEYVDDLSQVHSKIEEDIEEVLGNRPYQLTLKDTSDPALEEIYSAIHYYVEEARIRGNFGEMASESKTVLEQLGVDDFRLTINANKIYVQLRQHDSYLYRIVDLQTRGGAEL